MEQGRARRKETWSSSPVTRAEPTGSIPWRASSSCATSSCRSGSNYLRDKEAFLLEYGKRSPEAFRQSKEDLFSVQNSRKARIGGLEGLRDASFMKRKAEAEAELRSKVQASSSAQGDGLAAAWDKIAQAQKIAAENLKPYFYLERGFAFDSELFTIARILVRLAEEKTKPNSERLEEYRESALKSLELKIFSEAPIYPEFEEAKLAHSLAEWARLMPDDPLVERVLHGRSPAVAAEQLVAGSKLADVKVRRKLAEGGLAAIEASHDPMIKLAMAVDAGAGRPQDSRRPGRGGREDELCLDRQGPFR